MIFVTVGSMHMPFERLIDALDVLPAEELFVQHGPVEPPIAVSRAIDYMPFQQVVASIRQADAVVTHAGVGSVMCAVNAGHVPIVVPRLRRYGETVDDHQVELARALGEQGRVIPVWDVEDLADVVAEAPPRGIPAESRELPIHDAVRVALG